MKNILSLLSFLWTSISTPCVWTLVSKLKALKLKIASDMVRLDNLRVDIERHRQLAGQLTSSAVASSLVAQVLGKAPQTTAADAQHNTALADAKEEEAALLQQLIDSQTAEAKILVQTIELLKHDQARAALQSEFEAARASLSLTAYELQKAQQRRQARDAEFQVLRQKMQTLR